MPDRAVVDDDYWTAPLPKMGTPRCPLCDQEMTPNIGGTWTCHKDHTPAPRALVALSEDRQWLVVRCEERWGIFRYYLRTIVQGLSNAVAPSYRAYTSVDDTGQDAHEVLREFLLHGR